MRRERNDKLQDQASYAYGDVDYGGGVEGGSDDYDFADDSAYPSAEEEEPGRGGEAAGGEELVALSHQQGDGPYGIVKQYQDDHVCNIQVDVSHESI